MSNIDNITGLTPKQVEIYFCWDDIDKKFKAIVGYCFLGVLVDLIFLEFYLLTVFLLILVGTAYYFYSKKKKILPTDEQIDNAWDALAVSREEEVYRVANFKKSNVVRDSDFFLGFPLETGVCKYRDRISKQDNALRRNYLDVVRLIYGEDQIISFRETLCLEDGWDGLDEIKEYYWEDVAGIEFDQKEASFMIMSGGRASYYPLGKVDNNNNNLLETQSSLVLYMKKCESIANALRSVLRSKKAKK
jgi:cbb3-type cytochrome oxidase subunit 3